MGMIGAKYMGRAHTHGYTDLALFTDINAQFIKKTICATSPAVKETAERWGWESWTTDWRNIINDPEIDVVDIAGPSIIHSQIAIAAMKSGKHVLCEKPMAMNIDDAREMVRVAEEMGVVNMVGFNCRCVPAVELAKQMIDNGAVGRLYHFRGIYQQDWLSDPNYPITWRLKKDLAGNGVHGDQGAHVIDIMRYWIGEAAEVVCDQRIYYKKRPIAAYSHGILAQTGTEMSEVTADDASSMIIKFKDSDAMGYIESTRNGTGHKNQNRIEVSGEKGTIIFDMENMNVLQYYNAEDPIDQRGFKTIQVTEPNHPYMGNWWAAGHILGYGDTFIHQAKNLIEAIVEHREAKPNFKDGYECQRILEAGQISFEQHRWVSLEEIR